jgi:hypothetical protein
MSASSSDTPAHAGGQSVPPRLNRLPWLVAGGFCVLAIVAGVYAANLRNQLEDIKLRLVDAVMKMQVSEQQVEVAQAQVNAVRANLTLMTAPDVLDMKLAGAGAAGGASGRVFISRTRGLLFAASQMPQLPEGKTYQLWYLTKGDPVSAGLVRTDDQGNATAAFDVPPGLPVPNGFAVSMESEERASQPADDGASKPTGPMLLTSR